MCDEHIAAHGGAILFAGLCAPLRAAHVTATLLACLPRGDFTGTPGRGSPSRHADVVPTGGLCERFAKSSPGCHSVTAASSRAWHPVRPPPGFLDLSRRGNSGGASPIWSGRSRLVEGPRWRVLACLARLVFRRRNSQPR